MKIIGFFTPWIIYAAITLLHLILPARKKKGYARDKTGEVLNYRLNGIPVLIASILIWILLGYLDAVPFDRLYQVRWASLAGAVVMGLLFSFTAVLPYPSTGRAFPADLWFGRLKNPQFRGGLLDAKVWLYLTGAVMLQLNVLSFAAHHWVTHETINPGFLLGAGCLTYFIWDYLTFENVYLYTDDFTDGKVGFKMGFGCLSFYPFFYTVSLWSTVNLPDPGLPRPLTVSFAFVFFLGWILARGDKKQKYFSRIKPETTSDGERNIPANGFWDRDRRINYLGEILMACGIALSAGYPAVWQVWLYPFYFTVLTVTRRIGDGKNCRARK
jgi:delta14-sterol reductase